MRHRNLSKEPGELFKSDEFYFAAFKADAALTNYAEIPVKKGTGQDYVYAFLGGFAQDIGPYIPDEIIIVASAKNHVYMISAPAKGALTSIPECERTWDDFSARADEALEKYKESGNNNDKLFDDYSRMQDEGFVAYYTCFRLKAKTQLFLPRFWNRLRPW